MRPGLDDEVGQLNLGAKMRSSLSRLGVRTVREFLKLDVDRVLTLWGIGEGTRNQLLALQQFLSTEVCAGVRSTDEGNRLPAEVTFDDLRNQLSGRARRVIDRLGVETPEDLLAVKEEDVLGLPSIGYRTWKEIAALQERAKDWIPRDKSASQEEAEHGSTPIAQPIPEGVLARLPLYSTEDIVDKSLKTRLQATYWGNIEVCNLDLPSRAFTVLERLGIRTVAELVLTPSATLLRQRNFGAKTLQLTRKAIWDVMLSAKNPRCNVQELKKSPSIEAPDPNHRLGRHLARPVTTRYIGNTVDFTSFEAMVRTFLYCTLGRTPDSHAVLNSMGIVSDLPVGGRLATTRQCISPRYARHKASHVILRQIQRHDLLKAFWEAVAEDIRGGGGVVDLLHLSDGLRYRFKWARRPTPEALATILRSNSSLRVDEDNGIVLDTGCPCINCQTAASRLADIVRAASGDIHIVDAGYRLSNECGAQCTAGIKVPRSFNRGFIKLIASLSGELIVSNERVCSIDQWRLRNVDSLRGAIRATLAVAGMPMHYVEITERVRESYPQYSEVSNRQVYNCLYSHSDFRLEGQGKYGLAGREITPRKTPAEAVIEFLEKHDREMTSQQIISYLTRSEGFAAPDLQKVLCSHPRIVKVGHDLYNLTERVGQQRVARRADELILNLEGSGDEELRLTQLLAADSSSGCERAIPYGRSPGAFGSFPTDGAQASITGSNLGTEDVKLLLDLATTNLKTSYKPVLLLSILDCMGSNGRCSLEAVARRFAQFYLDRKKCRLPVETSGSSILSIIDDVRGPDLRRVMAIIERHPLRILKGSKLLSVRGKEIVMKESLLMALNPYVIVSIRTRLIAVISSYFESLPVMLV